MGNAELIAKAHALIDELEVVVKAMFASVEII